MKTKKEDHIRQRALSGLLYKALTDLLCTPEVSQEVCDLNVELSKVDMGTADHASFLGFSLGPGSESECHLLVLFGVWVWVSLQGFHMWDRRHLWNAVLMPD